MASLRLLIVAPDPLARAGLATLLSDQGDYDIVGQVQGDETLARELEVYQPDGIIWDLGWEPEEGLVLLEELDADEGGLNVVVLLPDDEQVAAAAWAAGARGLLGRDVTGEQLSAAVTAVANGLVTVEAGLSKALIPGGMLQEPAQVEELTPRELEVLQLVAEGLGNRAIALRLAISEHTVKFHVNAIMGKLGAQSRTAAVVRATRLGLIML